MFISERNIGYDSFLLPSQSVTVKEKYRNNLSEIMQSLDRLMIPQLTIRNNDEVTSFDPWEIRRRKKNYLSTQHNYTEILLNIMIIIMWICKDNIIPKISLQTKKFEIFDVSMFSGKNTYLKKKLLFKFYLIWK